MSATYLLSPPTPERRVDVAYMKEQLDNLTLRVASLEGKQNTQIEQTTRIEANTTELIATFNALQGAWKVLDWISRLAKPLSVIGAVFAAVTYWKSAK